MQSAIKRLLSNGKHYVAKRDNVTKGSILLTEYVSAISDTDVLSAGDLTRVLMGIYGEVGGIMSTAKKHVREREAYPGFRRATEEEFGDTLWYLAALCKRLGISLATLFLDVTAGDDFIGACAASDIVSGTVSHVATPATSLPLDDTLFALGRAAAALLDATVGNASNKTNVEIFARCYLSALHASGLSFANVVHMNIAKTRGAFISPNTADLPLFDDEFGEEERIPRNFRIRVSQRSSGKSYLRWNGVFIGDPLTDNSADRDGYRFHDVFHFAHAAILHWSPVFRALIKQKRKSKQEYDETEDGGRAVVIEEGLTAWIFAQAKGLNFFEGQDQISFGTLKRISEFVSGYEVERCPLKLWERAILDGYDVFRKVRDAGGGWVIGDRDARTIDFEPL
jgi:hypothetical protein